MSAQLDELIGLLDLEQIEEHLFRAYHPAGRQRRLYGGQIMAQALAAASRTVEDLGEARPVHSLHGYFLRPGDTVGFRQQALCTSGARHQRTVRGADGEVSVHACQESCLVE